MVCLFVCLFVGRCVHTHASDVEIEIDGSRMYRDMGDGRVGGEKNDTKHDD